MQPINPTAPTTRAPAAAAASAATTEYPTYEHTIGMPRTRPAPADALAVPAGTAHATDAPPASWRAEFQQGYRTWQREISALVGGLVGAGAGYGAAELVSLWHPLHDDPLSSTTHAVYQGIGTGVNALVGTVGGYIGGTPAWGIGAALTPVLAIVGTMALVGIACGGSSTPIILPDIGSGGGGGDAGTRGERQRQSDAIPI